MVAPVSLPAGRQLPSGPLTTGQLRVLKAIQRFARAEGHAPTVRQIVGLTDLTVADVRRHLTALARQGYLRRRPGLTHGIVVIRVTPEEVALEGTGSSLA